MVAGSTSGESGRGSPRESRTIPPPWPIQRSAGSRTPASRTKQSSPSAPDVWCRRISITKRALNALQ
eukprot:8688956-Pyramimonas_sp.AAC.1